MATKARSNSYLRNVGRSLGYAGLDVFEHYNPALSNIYKNTKDTVKEIKKSVRDLSMQMMQQSSDSGYAGQISGLLNEDTLSDVISGNLYHKKQEYKDPIKASGAEDWGDDTTANAVAETAADIMKQNEQNNRDLYQNIQTLSGDLSSTYTKATTKSAEYIAKSSARQTLALYNMTNKGFSNVTAALMSINNSIDGIAGMYESLSVHMKNSTTFYINATTSLNNIDANIAKLVKMQEERNKPVGGSKTINRKGVENLIDKDGNINGQAYVKMVTENMSQLISFMGTKDGKKALGKQDEYWLSKKGINNTGVFIGSTIDKMLPKYAKDAMQTMNEQLQAAMVAALTQGRKRSQKSSNPVVNLLGDLFLPKDGYTTKINTGNYEKGPVPWDGIARKSIVEVIPTYLAKIYAAVGGEEKYYDYETGKFVKLDQIKRDRDLDTRVLATKAGGQMRSDILTDIRKNASSQSKARLENEVEEFFLQAFIDGYDFIDLPNMINNKEFRNRYGLTRESAKYIAKYMTSTNATKRTRSTQHIANVGKLRNMKGDNIRRMETSGHSSMAYLDHDFNSSTLGPNSFAQMTDNFGHSQAYYLRGIYMMTGNIYGAVMSGKGGTKTKQKPIDPNKKMSSSMYFNPDTGKFAREKSSMIGERSNMDPKTNFVLSGNSNNKNNITIEDRAKYYGKTDEEILQIKKKTATIEKAREIWNGAEFTPIAGTDSSTGQVENKTKFQSALAKARDIYEMPFAAMTDMINSFTIGINNMFYGNKQNKGIFDIISDKLKSIWDKLMGGENEGKGLKQAIRDEAMGLWDRTETKVKSKMGNVRARNRAVSDRQAAEAMYQQAMNDLAGEGDIPGHARGRHITKTGLIAVSEGELVIPSEFNPYYHGVTNKQDQINKENNVIRKFYGSFAEGGTVGGNGSAYLNSKFVEDADPKTGKKIYKQIKPDGSCIVYKTKKDWLQAQAKVASYRVKEATQRAIDNSGAATVAADGLNTLGSGLMSFFKAALFGDEKQQKDDQEKVKLQVTDILKEAGINKGAVGLGAIAGTGVSVLTGAVVGPLAGAAIGAGVGLIAKSEKLQDALFGKPDKDGNYEKPIGNFMMKVLPDMGKGAAAGLTGGLLMGSPVVGAIVGAAGGWAMHSDKAKDVLFGKMDENGQRSKGGIFEKELRDKIKKAAPNIAAGGIAGLLVGPFGVAGNLLVGSAIGYLSTGEKFHNYFFGDGKDDKGLAGIIHDKIVNGIDDLFHNTSNAMKGWLRKQGKKIGDKIKGKIADSRAKYRNGEARGLTKLVGWAADKPGEMIKGATNMVGDFVQNRAAKRRAKNLSKGYDVWNADEKRNMIAGERDALRPDNDTSVAGAFDKLLAGSNAADLDNILAQLKNLDNPNLQYKQIRSKALTGFYSDLEGSGIKDKDVKRLVKEMGSSGGILRAEEVLRDSNGKFKYDDATMDKIRSAFGKANNTITNEGDIKNIKRGTIQRLRETTGIDLSDAKDISNFINKTEYEKKVRFGEGQDPEKRDERYQDNVVNFLDNINKNISLGIEYFTGKRAADGKITGTVDENGKSHYKVNGQDGEISFEEASKIHREQRDLGERFRDTKAVIADAAKETAEVITEPIEKAITGSFNLIKDEIVTPLVNTVRVTVNAANDIKNIAIRGYREETIDVPDDEYYGPTSNIDIINKGREVISTGKNIGKRIGRGAREAWGAISGKAEGGPVNDPKKTFLDLVAEKIIEKTGGIKQFFSRNSESDQDDTANGQRVEMDFLGNVHQYSRNNQGEWTEVDNDNDTKKSRSIMEKFTNSIHSIPGITTAIGGLTGLVGLFKDKLIGDEKKPGLLSKMLKGLIGEEGILSNLFSLFTGGLTGKNIGKKLLGSTTLTGIVTEFVGPGLLAAGLGGKFDEVAKEITGGAYGSTENYSYIDSKTGTKLTKNSDGTYTDKDGNIYDAKDVKVAKTDVTSFSGKLKQNAVRGALTNTASVTSKVLGKTTIGKAVKKGASSIVEAVGGNTVGLADSVYDGLIKVVGALKKVPILKNLAEPLENAVIELTEKVSEKLASDGAKKLLGAASNFVVFARIAFAVADFTTGYQDANSTFSISGEPSTGQKIVSGIIRAVKNCVPVVGTLIPDSLLVDIFVKYIAPVLGMDVEELKNQRAQAQAELDEYNAANGTNLTFQEYNKSVLGNYTWTEKISNGVKTGWNKLKDGTYGANIKTGWNNFKQGASNKLNSFKDGVSEKYNTAKAFVQSGFDKIGESFDGVKKSASYLMSLPKTIYKDTKDMVYDENSTFKEFLNVDKYKQDGDGKIFNGIITGVSMTSRILSLVSMIAGRVGKTIGEFFGNIKDKVVSMGSAIVDIDKNELRYMLKGDTSGMFNYVGSLNEDGENPLGWMSKAYGYIGAIPRTIPSLMFKLGWAVKDVFVKIKDKTISVFDTMSNIHSTVLTEAKQGNVGGMFNSVTAMGEDPENPLGWAGKIYGYIDSAFMTPTALLYKAGHAIGDWFGEKVDAFKADSEKLSSSREALKSMVHNSDSSIGDIMSYDAGFSDNNILKGVFKGVFGIQKIFYSVAKLASSLFDGVMDVVDGVKEKVGAVVDWGADKVDTVKNAATGAWNSAKNFAGNVAESAWSGVKGFITGSGSGFVSQFDPRYQNYNVSGQNFAAKGCGPAVATMAARALGKNVSVGDAVNSSVGYQNGNGVSIDYFQNMLGSKGINTRYISGGSSAELYNSIAHGDKVVLLGRDPMNTSKDVSPFGPNNHYVLATGLDRRGNVIINDPESNGPRSYSPAILNSAKFGVAGSNSGIGRSRSILRNNKFRTMFSGGTSYDTDIARQVWAFLIQQGYSPECAAGIMGNLYAESGMNPAIIQGNGKGPAAGLCQWENYNTKSGRWKQMADFAKSRGRDWTDLDSQLNFMQSELTSADINNRLQGKTSPSNFASVGLDLSKGLSYSQWKVCKDVAQATYLFEVAFERAGKPRMDARINAATAYYNLYSGKSYTYDGSLGTATYNGDTSSSGYSSTSSGSESGGLFSNIWNVISDIGTVFSNAFNGKSSSSASSGSYGSSGSFSSDQVVSNAAIGEGNQTQKALVEKLLGIQGKIDYSMSGARNPEAGSADCSSTVNWAYKKVTGKDIGNDTASILSNSNTEVIDLANLDPNKGGTNSTGPNESKLMPGDILLYSRPTSDYSAGRKYRVGHVEMYVGNGQRIGHGGGKGPKVTPLSTDANRYIEAKRLKGITDGSLSAAGSGLLSYQDIANMSGGSSGILMNARPGSMSNMPARMSNGRLVPVSRFSGGASDILTGQTQSMLSNLSTQVKNSNGISPELVSKLITSITQILERIANNTAPVNQIYQALLAYVQSGGDSGTTTKPVPVKVNNQRNNQPVSDEIDPSISTLVGVLAELAKG